MTEANILGNSFFGISVAGSGDINKDGYSDIIIGAHRYHGYKGRCYIYMGGESFDTLAAVILDGETTLGDFGSSVDINGDVNNDGYADILVGSPGVNDYGRSYIYFGGETIDNIVDINFFGETTYNSGGN